MESWTPDRILLLCIASAAVAGIAGYIFYVTAAWRAYGRNPQAQVGDNSDPLLDRFLPHFEVRERHQISIAAPATIAFDVARNMDLSSCGMIRAVFRMREWIVGSELAGKREDSHEGLVAQSLSQGWGVLAEIPGRVVVMGAVTQPWAKSVVFRAIPPEQFANFAEPGFVKIVWTLRVDPKGPGNSYHSTETRAVATGPVARAAFRRYWAFFSAGIVLIRLIAIRLVKVEAERAARSHSTSAFLNRLKAGSAHHN